MKRMPIAELEGAALNRAFTSCRGWRMGMTADLSRESKRAIVAAHSPDGFVEVPDELAPSYKTATQHPVDS